MNKHLTSLVAIAAVTTMGITSIPADAMASFNLGTVIQTAIDEFKLTNNTEEAEIEQSIDAKIAATTSSAVVYTSDVDIVRSTLATETTTGAAVINVKVTTQGAVTPIFQHGYDKVIATEAAVIVDPTDEYPILSSDLLTQDDTTTPGAVLLTWENATDNTTPQNQLKYSLYMKENKAYDTIEEWDMNAELLTKADNINSFYVSGLKDTSSYYFKLIVEDLDGNKTEYSTEVREAITKTPLAENTELKDIVNNTLKSLTLTNYYRGYKIERAIEKALMGIELDDINVSVHDFALTPAVGTTSGLATGYIVVTDYEEDDTLKIPFELAVSEGTEDKNDEKYTALDDAMYDIQVALDKLKVSNNTTANDIQNCASNAIAGKTITVAISDFNVEELATNTRIGYMDYKINLTDTTNKLKIRDDYQSNIDTTATAKLRATVKSYLDGLVVSNSMNEHDILAAVTGVLNDSTVKVDIIDFYLKKAISGNVGYCDFAVQLKDSYDNYLLINYSSDEFTSTAGTSGSSSSSSSSHHSSSGSSSSSSSSSAGSNSTTSSANTSATGALTAGESDSTKPVSLSNMSKEAVKAVEAKVVSNIISITGAVAGQAKEIATADGTKVSVTTITKDGKSAGAVITAETSSAKAIIPVDKDAAPVAAVYKFVPLLGKYIQVQDAVITADAVTLPVQANATYVASPVVMPTTETIAQGWVKAADNNWYMVNATGDPLTGWQKDSTGWTYMSPATGAMQTGWAQTGSTWYYLKDNGYMATGWVKDGAKWYYCNADGSMAANTTVDGYTIGSNGAWIS